VKKGKHRTYAEKERDGEITKLKNANRRLKSENDKLKSEIRMYQAAFEKNIQFLKGKTKDLTLEELIEGAKKEQNLGQIEKQKEMSFKEMEDKWKCHVCKKGIMKLIVYTRHDGRWYLRSCGNKPSCSNRTNAQPFHDGVDGIK